MDTIFVMTTYLWLIQNTLCKCYYDQYGASDTVLSFNAFDTVNTGHNDTYNILSLGKSRLSKPFRFQSKQKYTNVFLKLYNLYTILATALVVWPHESRHIRLLWLHDAYWPITIVSSLPSSLILIRPPVHVRIRSQTTYRQLSHSTRVIMHISNV